jgi:alkanesulfonate monooxygenase SsuD/methylene tetrahydromethanopterin reductase-like flavin-dependent oxidoreductase (luciferase family)
MKFGFSLSNNQGIDDVQAIVRLAIRAEELGFDSVWASDHVFNVSYVFERIGDKPYYDPLVLRTANYPASLAGCSLACQARLPRAGPAA